MSDQKYLKYGRINKASSGDGVFPVPMAAAQAVKAKSGRFVYMNAGAATLCVAASTTIYGFLNTHEHTPDTGDLVGCDTDLRAVYRIPINSGTYAVGMIGDYCDLSVSGGIQGAALDASVRDLLIIVGGDAVDNEWVDVKMNPAKVGTGLGADA